MRGMLKRKYVILAAAMVILGLAAFYILPVSVPLIAALITALLLEPLVRMLQSKFKMKRHYNVMIVFTVFTLVMGIGIYFTTTKVISQGVKLVEDLPEYVNNVSRIWYQYEEQFKNTAQALPKEMVHAVTHEINTFLNTIVTSVINYINIENISSALSYIPNFLVSFLVYLIALFLFMLDLPKIRNRIYRHLTDQTSEKVNFMTKRISTVVFGFCKAQFLVSLLILGVSLIGLLIISPKTAIIMSIIIWIIDLIPIIGSIVILAPWSLYHLLTGNVILGTQLAVLATVLLIIRRTVEPKVMGTHIGLSPLATLIAMYLGLKLFGFLGFFIGPMLLIVFKTAREAEIIKLNFKI
ncbi:sporulation integral membrane protein YtvI [Bacillus thermophilus]|uniref:Sporulation integral membrane protein YtvI n=2 Tax=Siminovitchia TaxID=2837510 RepID=A0ABS2RBP9_9BACI|nr:sporulation integral membrane protein YtvI [Siminovitchia thermophila]